MRSQYRKIVISTKAGVTVDDQKIKDAVTHAGDYKITGSTPKK